MTAAAVLLGAASAKADNPNITNATLGGGLSIGNQTQLGTGSFTRFTNTASSGVGADGPFVSAMGSTIEIGSEVLAVDSRVNWDFEVFGPPNAVIQAGTQVAVTITGTYDASVTTTTGGAVGNIFVGDGLFDLTDAFHQECDGPNHGQCGQEIFSVEALVPVNQLQVIEIQVDGGAGAFNVSLDPMMSLSSDLLGEGYTLQVEPDALPPAGGGVPEPAAWALMIAGFGIVGASLRRRRTLAA